MDKIRVGAVNYLNTKPLVRRLPELAPEIDLVLDVPSQLAVDLEEGRLDVALIPSIEYFRGGRYSIIPGVSISSYGPVVSVKLCSRVPFRDVRRIALDEGSRTSIALLNILLHHLFGVDPKTEPMPLYKEALDSKTDATLVIGDRALRVPDGSFPYTLDLGYEWSRWHGLPFVWAFWAVAPGVELSPKTMQAFVRAKELGKPEIPAIAKSEAARLRVDEASCQYYLQHVIRHDFGSEELEGLTRFYEAAVERGLAPEGVSCVFHGSQSLAKSH
ncbi:MAG: menaquinone biosynthetic enzyme MqnA/MqnD family protein [Planctomycetia bacterium]